jgi:hypothetical protein
LVRLELERFSRILGVGSRRQRIGWDPRNRINMEESYFKLR